MKKFSKGWARFQNTMAINCRFGTIEFEPDPTGKYLDTIRFPLELEKEYFDEYFPEKIDYDYYEDGSLGIIRLNAMGKRLPYHSTIHSLHMELEYSEASAREQETGIEKSYTTEKELLSALLDAPDSEKINLATHLIKTSDAHGILSAMATLLFLRGWAITPENFIYFEG